MKLTAALMLIFAVLAVSQGSVLKSSPARANLNVGVVGPYDRLLHRQYVYRAGVANTIQSEDLIYRGNASTLITSVRANEVGYTQYAVPRLIAGGVGRNNVTIRFQSARGYGYYYLVDIYGR